MNIILQDIDYNNKNINNHLLEEFLHNISGKINVFKLMLEMHYSIEDLKKNMEVMEGLLLLYRGILLKRPEIKISISLLVNLFKDRGAILICNDLTYFNQKVYILCIIHNLTSTTTTITFEKETIVFFDSMEENIIELEKKIQQQFLIGYKVIDKNTFIFYLNNIKAFD